MSSSTDTELEEQLLDAGSSLVDPPSSDDQLLLLLDKVENCLSRVEQSPTKSMQSALSPSLRALVTNQLLHHPNADVKVSVASCISEITRITAPDAPYDDDQMMEVFQLIVSSFENLSDKSSRSYSKRTSILETVAKVRSCVVMLDLECDALILDMFDYFFSAIRDYHPDNVFTSMETIMTLVLEESEDISPELLSPILASVKKDKEVKLPIAYKLGEKVLKSCATKVKPYLIQAVKSLGICLDDYSQIVTSICQEETSSAVEQSNDHATTEQMAEENKLERTSLEDAAQVDKEMVTEEVSPEHVDPAIRKSPKSVMGNGITQTQTREDESILDSNFKKQGDDHHADQSKSTSSLDNAEIDNMTEKAECKLEQTPKRRGRKPNFSKSKEPSDGSCTEGEKEAEKLLDNHKLEQTTKRRGRKPSSSKSKEPSDGSCTEGEKEAEKLVDNHKGNSKDDASSPCEDPTIVATVPFDHVKDVKALECESGNVATPLPNEGLPEEGRSRKAGRPKKKNTSTKYATPSTDAISRKVSEATTDAEAKPAEHSGKNPAFGVSNDDSSATTAVASKKESGDASDSEAKTLKQLAKKVEMSGDNGDGFALKHLKDKKKRGRPKAVTEKDETKLPSEDDGKETLSSLKANTKSKKDDQLEETPLTNSKRMRTPVLDKATGAKKDGEELVGSKIKVWWPKDRMFYEGVVDSYDSVKKRHKVLYIDGDEEILYLKRERWELCDSESDEVEEAGETSLDASIDVPLKKAKTNLDLSAKQGNAPSKRGGGASSSKAKGSGAKSGHKSGDDAGRVVGKFKDDESASKSEVQTPTGGSKSVNLSKAANRSKDDDTGGTKSSKSKDVVIMPKFSSPQTKQDTPKTTNKSKQDTPKAVNKSKGKIPNSGGKSSANGNGKVKSGSSKVKESEDVEVASSDSADVPESVKGKSPESSKAQGSEAKTSGKKRRRGGKS